MLKSIFLGNSEFCTPTIQILNHLTDLKAIVTGQDKFLLKRKKITIIPEPKEIALQLNIPFLQPSKMKDPEFLETLKSLQPDIMIILSYGFILPPILYNIPPLGCYNLHASLLPSYRGASPIQESLLNNDSHTGITLQKINENIDEGNIYHKKEVPIDPYEVYPTLRQKLSLTAAETLTEFLEFYQKHKKFPNEKVQEGTVSLCSKIKKEDGVISFSSMSALHIYSKYRAFYSWPQISFYHHSTRFILKNIQMISSENNNTPGSVIQANKKGLFIQTQNGVISIIEIQPENKKKLNFVSFINGYNIKVKDQFL